MTDVIVPVADDIPNALSPQNKRRELFRKRLDSVRAELREPLYRNAYLLIINTASTSALGFLYWIAAAHAYKQSQVGRNSALISAMVLLSAIAQLNFVQVLMRYLPVAGRYSQRLVKLAYWLPAIASVILASAVLCVAHFVTSSQNVLHTGIPLGLWFVGSVVGWSLFNIQDAALIGMRRTFWVPVDNATFGVVKILLLFPFVGLFDGWGLFLSWTLPVLFSLVPLHYLIFWKFVPKHEARSKGDEKPLGVKAVSKFIAFDYVGWLCSQANVTVVPLMVVSILGAKDNGIYYIAQIIGVALDVFVANLMTSLMVEAAGNLESTRHFSHRIIKRVLVLVLPAVLVVVAFAPLILGVFGSDYSGDGTTLLRLLALSSLPRTLLTLFSALSRVSEKTHRIAVVQCTQALIIVVMSTVLMHLMGLVGVGVALLASAGITALAITPALTMSLGTRYIPKHMAK